ncbi:MAG TPA: urocanate hydratase [Oligoflexia bacterium]|nr:urocanate hydratase [Oligoflexia bacterium]HMR24905.1 urocanate hydratase [Oligoflexia bacterium]
MNTDWIKDLDLSHITVPTGQTLHTKGWQQEAVLRMLLNNLDHRVAEDPQQLIVYGGTGKAARNRECLEAILYELCQLEDKQTLLVQSGKPVGVIQTHPDAPRVMIANSNLVPKWATWEHFHELDQKGLMMYGQMTAGSWIYIGSQGIIQGTYETFAAAAQKHYQQDNLAGKLVVTAGLGGMGGAQPLAAKIAKACSLSADIDKARIQRRLDDKYLDVLADSIDEAIDLALEHTQQQRNTSIGVHCNAVDLLQALLDRNITPDLLTDQTSAHDPLNGYVPQGLSMQAALDLRHNDPKSYTQKSLDTMVKHVTLMNQLMERGAHTFDYGNNLRGFAKENGMQDAFRFEGFVPKYIRPLFCEGSGPFRFVALSGDPQDIEHCDQALLELFPEEEKLKNWLLAAKEHIPFQGLPSRICWLKYGQRQQAALKFNELVANGTLKAPIVIGRDHLDCGSVASPNRETEGMKDGSDAVSDWPLLNLMSSTASGATWVSFHHGGGVGMGYSQHAGLVVLVDGSEACKQRLSRVLNNDPQMGVLRHCDAGYEEALDFAQQHNIHIPMVKHK